MGLIVGCTTTHPAAHKSFILIDKVILEEDPPAQFFYWDLENEDHLWSSELGKVTAMWAYQDTLQKVLGVEKL